MWSPQTSFVNAEPAVYWTSQPRPVPIQPPLPANSTADLVIIGGGFTGLWAAIEAKQRDPDRDVVLLEMERIAFGATNCCPTSTSNSVSTISSSVAGSMT